MICSFLVKCIEKEYARDGLISCRSLLPAYSRRCYSDKIHPGHSNGSGKRQHRQQLYRHQRALIFPGQGSQFIGMGRDIYNEFSLSRQVFEEADETLGTNLSRLMFEGSRQEITLTKNAQPAIVTVSIATLRALEHATGMDASALYSFTMGHSVGEYSALIAAQAMSFAAGIDLVRTRGEAMQDAIQCRDYTMAACILHRSRIEDVVADVGRVQQDIIQGKRKDTEVDDGKEGAEEVVQVANINSSSQVVLSGTRQAVDLALSSLQSKRLAMRAVNLPVSAPFHCKLMAPAKPLLEERIAKTNPVHDVSKWSIPVVSNVTAQAFESAADTQRLLVEQIDKPVLWFQSMELLKHKHGISRWGAIGPGNVVGNLAGKEYAKDIVRRLSDVTAIRDFVAVLDRQEKRGY